MGTAALTDQWLLLDSAQGDPFGQLDEFLAWHGFGVWSEPFVPAADGLVADLYLGYGLAAALPGVNEPMPPEPCPLPALACHVRSASGGREAVAGDFRIGRFQPTWTALQHREAVAAVRAAIARGDVYQVNIVGHHRARFAGDPSGVEAALAPLGAEHAMAMHGDGWSVVSATWSRRCRSRARDRPTTRSGSPTTPRTGPST
jgi:para-aminobenzoate synthetase component 1